MSSGIRLKYEDVKSYFEEKGCELLEEEYKNARTKMKYRCSCGNVSSIVYDSFKRGNRCQECGNRKSSQKQSLTQSQAEQKFKDCGCVLLGEYQGSSVKVKYQCECGRVSESTPNNIWRGRRCMDCGTARRSSSHHYMWRKDRKKFEWEYTFRQRCYKLIRMVLKVTGRVKNEKTAALLGYDYKQLQKHITGHPDWLELEGKKWHIDHIFPIKAFLDYGISDLKFINDLDNLRPMLGIENCKKNAKYDKKAFEAYLESKGVKLCLTK